MVPLYPAAVLVSAKGMYIKNYISLVAKGENYYSYIKPIVHAVNAYYINRRSHHGKIGQP